MTLQERIDKIPGEQGFWKSATHAAYHSAATQLSAVVMSEDAIVELLNRLYWSTAEEYGG